MTTPHRVQAQTVAGSATLIAISVTTVVFLAAVGLASIVILSLKGAVNVAAANGAYYAAEASVEKTLYALVGHTPGFELPSRDLVEGPDNDGSVTVYLSGTAAQLPIGEDDGGALSRATSAAIARSRTARLPLDAQSWISLGERSSVTVRLSVDVAASPDDPPTPQLLLTEGDDPLDRVSLEVAIPTLGGVAGNDPDPPADWRVNPWRGPAIDPCSSVDDALVPLEPTADYPQGCLAHPSRGVVEPDDPDVGLPIIPFYAAYRPCDETVASDCAERWTANPVLDFEPIASTSLGSDRAMILNDLDQDYSWSSTDLYLLEGVWPVEEATVPAGAPPPAVGQPMVQDPLPDPPTFFSNGVTVLTLLDPSDATYEIDTDDGPEFVPGALSGTGEQFGVTAPDNYLYIDVCTDPAITDCNTAVTAAGGAPDGRVSAPWNLELVLRYTTYDRDVGGEITDTHEYSARRRILDTTSSPPCVTSKPGGPDTTFLIPSLSCLFPEERFPGFLSRLEAEASDANVSLSLATNTRKLDVQIVLQDDPTATPLGSDTKTTITTVGMSGSSSQTLRTTVTQDETLPVFQHTTVF